MGIPRELEQMVLDYFAKIEKMLSKFISALDRLNTLDLSNAYRYLADSVKLDTEADALRRKIFENLTTISIDEALREELARLLRMMDKLSESIKEASRYLEIVPYFEIPQDLKSSIVELSKLCREAVKTLSRAIQALMNRNSEEAFRLAVEVEKIEERADEELYRARKNLVLHGKKIGNIAAIVMLKSFIEALEDTTDYAEDIADILRVLALRFIG